MATLGLVKILLIVVFVIIVRKCGRDQREVHLHHTVLLLLVVVVVVVFMYTVVACIVVLAAAVVFVDIIGQKLVNQLHAYRGVGTLLSQIFIRPCHLWQEHV